VLLDRLPNLTLIEASETSGAILRSAPHVQATWDI
jgi:hypothetical protein